MLNSKLNKNINVEERLKKVRKKLNVAANTASTVRTGTILAGAIAATIPAFPLFAWAAKAEVNASRKGRFEAMRKELQDPSAFAILTPEQEKELKILTEKYPVLPFPMRCLPQWKRERQHPRVQVRRYCRRTRRRPPG